MGGAVFLEDFHHVLPWVVDRRSWEGSESKCRKMTHAIKTVWMLVDSVASGGCVCGGEKNHCGVQETVVRLSSYIVIRLFSRAAQEIMES